MEIRKYKENKQPVKQELELTRVVLEPPSMYSGFEGLQGGQVVQGSLLDHHVPEAGIFGLEGT